MTKHYKVLIPFTGIVQCNVVANDKQDAINKALRIADIEDDMYNELIEIEYHSDINSMSHSLPIAEAEYIKLSDVEESEEHYYKSNLDD